jgi:dTDP-4-amino-4,6-dideoxygalactose transaminase
MTKLALNGGTPIRTDPWPRWPVYDDRERQLLLEAFDSGEWGGFPFPQPKTKELGEKFAAYQDARYGAACTNGSISLEICLRAAGIKAGDEVIVPATTWIATGAAPVFVNAVPVFVDVRPDNYCIDCEAVEAAITDRTRAIIPVHLGSSMADLDHLTEIARKHSLVIIEDCAHAHGCKWKDKGAGSWGDFGSFSFQSSKILTAGEGGLITTNDRLLHEKVQSIINCGRKDEGYDSFPGHILGYNARMTELQAAIMLAQLDRMDELIRRKSEAVHYLTHRMTLAGGLYAVPRDVRESRRGYYQFIWKYKAEEFKGLHRDRFLQALEAEGIELDGMFYPPMPFHPLFNARSEDWPMLRERYGDGIQAPETLRKFDFPVGKKFAQDEGIWMHYPYLLATKADLDDIVEAVIKIRKNVDELL